MILPEFPGTWMRGNRGVADARQRQGRQALSEWTMDDRCQGRQTLRTLGATPHAYDKKTQNFARGLLRFWSRFETLDVPR